MKIPRSVELLIGCGGIFFSFSYFAVLQEDVYKKKYGEDEERFGATLLAIGIERGINALIALLGIGIFGGSGIKIPIMDIFNSGISQMLAMATSNEALRYVSFPTQVLGKSCKMVPTMAGGIIIGGKKYSFAEYVQVIMVTVGVCVFNFAGKSKKGGADSSYGLMLIGGSLLLDMVTSGMQDKVKAKTKVINPSQPKAKPTQYESMFYTNLSGCLIAFLLGVLKGDLATGVAFCLKCERSTLPGTCACICMHMHACRRPGDRVAFCLKLERSPAASERRAPKGVAPLWSMNAWHACMHIHAYIHGRPGGHDGDPGVLARLGRRPELHLLHTDRLRPSGNPRP